MAQWPQEHVELLRDLAASGLSSGQMMERMRKHRPGVTHSAICGQCARHGIEIKGGQAAPINRKRKAKQMKPRPTKPSAPVDAPPLIFEPADESAWDALPGCTPIPLISRRDHECPWPIGAPARPADLLCCGAPRDGRRPYCVEHMRRHSPRWIPRWLREAANIKGAAA